MRNQHFRVAVFLAHPVVARVVRCNRTLPKTTTTFTLPANARICPCLVWTVLQSFHIHRAFCKALFQILFVVKLCTQIGLFDSRHKSREMNPEVFAEVWTTDCISPLCTAVISVHRIRTSCYVRLVIHVQHNVVKQKKNKLLYYDSATSVFESQRSRSTSTIAKRRAVYKKHFK